MVACTRAARAVSGETLEEALQSAVAWLSAQGVVARPPTAKKAGVQQVPFKVVSDPTSKFKAHGGKAPTVNPVGNPWDALQGEAED